ncbi:phosphotransferase enzyme family protein [Humibacillus xanthopallidus]|uniref:Ser/Thr protein kinase RdoA (MazF antagonist) n=1 Tax=Humibacillus xanthopallidus TaxID=412689 RepID=A0A543I3I1_9MICO|nr:aminoglycoside phosphotransferase family protein [Humibacillus xanthopallidus]TQM65111.1 Ser/Thr protein kinase RdoA (MazF antagonist) [Humibacillus xanthopallidus]
MLSPTDADAVAAAYGLSRPATLTGPVARGQLGQVWRLDTPEGPYAVKEWFAEPDLADVARDADLVVAARAQGVTTPEIIRTPDGAVATVLPGRGDSGGSGSSGGTAIRVFEWVDLRPRTRLLDPAAVGAMLAGLHRAGAPTRESVDNWFSTGVGETTWVALQQRVAREGAPFAPVLGSLLGDLVAVESVMEPHEAPIVCHRDLWADNVLGTVDGDVCVIDFENLGPADPSQELAMVLFEFGDDDPARARTIHTAYLDGGGPGRVTRRGHFTMLVAEQAHIGQLACSRWVGASDEAERERLAAWFLEIPEDPVTLARIDRILAAVT